MNITNPIYKEFIKLNLIKRKNLVKISDVTRDKKIKVYKDTKSEIIFLEKYTTSIDYYSSFKKRDIKKKEKQDFSIINLKSGKIIKSKTLDDDKRRYITFKKKLKKKNVLDFGCGWGGFLSYLKNYSGKCSGLELRKHCINYIKKNLRHIDIHNNLNKFKNLFDVITLFHVLEHIPHQVKSLKEIKKKLKKNGLLIIEVPCAKDHLITLQNLPEFKTFTFWSEHLVLHTEQSLRKILTKAGFKNIKINYFQRYGFTNHLGWYLRKKPGGHDYFHKYENKILDVNYKKFLEKNKQADTLIAIVKK